MSGVLDRLEDCLRRQGYPQNKIERQNGRLSFPDQTPKGKPFEVHIESHSSFHVTVFTKYMPSLPKNVDPQIVVPLYRLLVTFLNRGGGGVYYKLGSDGAIFIEGGFVANEDAKYECMNLIRLKARIGRLRDFLDDDLKSLADV